MVNGKPFTRNHLARNCRYAKQALLCLVKSTHVNGIELIVWVKVEAAIYEPKQEPWCHVEREFPRWLNGNEHGKQDGYQ